MKPAIRFIIETYTSWDRSGNASRWARITSTITGKSLDMGTVGGARNAPGIVFKAIDERRPDFDTWSWIHATEQDIPRKQWSPPRNAPHEWEVTPKMILGLERKK